MGERETKRAGETGGAERRRGDARDGAVFVFVLVAGGSVRGRPSPRFFFFDGGGSGDSGDDGDGGGAMVAVTVAAAASASDTRVFECSRRQRKPLVGTAALKELLIVRP